MNVVVVESPAKAKTINKYLGADYTVLASYGHIRDLPAKDGSVRPDDDFAMDWEVEAKSDKRLREIVQALKGAKALFLATDPDREGEAISWHVREELKQRRALKDIPVKRVVFNEVTKSAVLEAFKHARELDDDLVDAYMARRALDYLVGFTLSPVLWRKLPGSRSAGRVQSVALRLICDREAEIEIFRPREYWSVESRFRTGEGAVFAARLTHLDGKKLERFDLPDEASAQHAVAAIESERGYLVYKVENRQVRRNPPPPFTTSTLQQEASRKLGFGTSRTMQLAQRLYEGAALGGETVGLITYMRTDGVSLSDEAVAASRALIERDYGPSYRPAQPRHYKTVAKNAQEAHEAIRPTDFFRKPADVAAFLEPDQLRLYELIWKRSLACQMEAAVLDQAVIDINGAAGRASFRATGSVIRFDGFLKLYQEGKDDEADEEEGRRLPALKAQDQLDRLDVAPAQHFTEPPPRYTEASLVKRLEELGIGRPSTYASIIQVLLDRDYVKLEKKRFEAEDRGRLVTAFLQRFFERYVEYSFTADLENLLDEISGGRAEWKEVLRQFWTEFSLAIGGTKELTISQVLTALDEALGPHFFPENGAGHDVRLCPSCQKGRLSLKLGKFGAFIGCANYPECRFTRRLGVEAEAGDEAREADAGPRLLGPDPATGRPVAVKNGPYGPYIQLGEGNEDGEKPKRVSLPKGLKPQDLDLDRALALLSLPREIGTHPETGDIITAGIGRYGPYLKHGKIFKSLTADDDVLTIGINRAVSLLGEPAKAGRGPVVLRTIGAHPAGGATIELYKGRFGPYVSHGGVNATIPRGTEPETVTIEQAVTLLEAQKAKGKPVRGKPAGRKQAAKPADAAEEPAPKAKRAAPAATDGAAKPAAKRKAAGTAKKTAAKKAPAKKGAAATAAADQTAEPAKPTNQTAEPAKPANQTAEPAKPADETAEPAKKRAAGARRPRAS